MNKLHVDSVFFFYKIQFKQVSVGDEIVFKKITIIVLINKTFFKSSLGSLPLDSNTRRKNETSPNRCTDGIGNLKIK
jgi:hypothetical protein